MPQTLSTEMTAFLESEDQTLFDLRTAQQKLNVLPRLQNYIKTIDANETNTPTCLTLLSSGDFQVKYSLGTIPLTFKSLDDALDSIHRFLQSKRF